MHAMTPASIFPTTNAFFDHGPNVRSLTLHPIVLLPNNTVHGVFRYGKLQPAEVCILEEHWKLQPLLTLQSASYHWILELFSSRKLLRGGHIQYVVYSTYCERVRSCGAVGVLSRAS